MLKNLFQDHRFTVLNTALLTLNLSLGAYYITKTPQKIEVVNMAKIISNKAKDMAQKYPGGNVPQPLMQQTIDELKECIEEFGRQNNITILAKGAVLSGDFKDCTHEFVSAQEEK